MTCQDTYDAAGNLDTVGRDGTTVADYSYDSRNLTTGATFGNALIDSRVERHRLAREPHWTESVAVGSESFVEEIAERVGRRSRLELEPMGDAGEDSWRVREVSPSYS